MNIYFDDTAKDFLVNKIPNNSQVILATDDGSTKYSSVGATCALADKFQLIILKHADPTFTTELENNATYHLHMLPADEYLVGPGLKVTVGHGTLILRDDHGILDSALSVVDWRNVNPETAEDRMNMMVKLGDQIC